MIRLGLCKPSHLTPLNVLLGMRDHSVRSLGLVSGVLVLILAACAPMMAQRTPTPVVLPVETREQLETRVSPVDGMELALVPAGEFEMGYEDEEISRSHAVQLMTPETVFLGDFWIDRTEVTNGMYRLCVQAGDCDPPGTPVFAAREDYFDDPALEGYPVVGVTWDNAVTYCEWAGRHLPTEAEWEKAARGSDGRMFPWGNEQPTCTRANFARCSNSPLPVGLLPLGASPYGALDMAGNVWEWTADWYPPEAYPTLIPGLEEYPFGDAVHVVRGGSWADEGITLGTFFRFYGYPIDALTIGYGFRCAAEGGGG